MRKVEITNFYTVFFSLSRQYYPCKMVIEQVVKKCNVMISYTADIHAPQNYTEGSDFTSMILHFTPYIISIIRREKMLAQKWDDSCMAFLFGNTKRLWDDPGQLGFHQLFLWGHLYRCVIQHQYKLRVKMLSNWRIKKLFPLLAWTMEGVEE